MCTDIRGTQRRSRQPRPELAAVPRRNLGRGRRSGALGRPISHWVTVWSAVRARAERQEAPRAPLYPRRCCARGRSIPQCPCSGGAGDGCSCCRGCGLPPSRQLMLPFPVGRLLLSGRSAVHVTVRRGRREQPRARRYRPPPAAASPSLPLLGKEKQGAHRRKGVHC